MKSFNNWLSVAKGVLCYLISNQLIALGIFPTNKTLFGQKMWRGPTKTPRKIVPAALAGAGEQHFSEFSWLEAIGLGGARWSKLCQELVPAANLSTNTRLLSSWTWFKISCEGQLRESSSSAGSPLVRNWGDLSRNDPPCSSHINFSCNSHTFTWWSSGHV